MIRIGLNKLISSSMSRHLSTGNISAKSIHAFLSNLANRQTDRQTPAVSFTSSVVGGNYSKTIVFFELKLFVDECNDRLC